MLRSTGFAMTPAVQMIRSDSKVSPVDISTWPPTAEVSWVSRCTSAPRSARFFSTQWLVSSETSGMMRPIASMRWKWVSSNVSVG